MGPAPPRRPERAPRTARGHHDSEDRGRRLEVLKELGIWLDGLGDWGEQMQKIRAGLSEMLLELGRKRIPLELALYLWKAVITPKALYPLAVASPPDEEISELEKWARGQFRHQFGVHPGFPRLLTSIAPEAGGWGLDSWRSLVAKARRR